MHPVFSNKVIFALWIIIGDIISFINIYIYKKNYHFGIISTFLWVSVYAQTIMQRNKKRFLFIFLLPYRNVLILWENNIILVVVLLKLEFTKIFFKHQVIQRSFIDKNFERKVFQISLRTSSIGIHHLSACWDH